MSFLATITIVPKCSKCVWKGYNAKMCQTDGVRGFIDKSKRSYSHLCKNNENQKSGNVPKSCKKFTLHCAVEVDLMVDPQNS